jgi:hypothetical protein
MLVVSVRAPIEDWRGCFDAPWGRYDFDRAYTKSEWDNWTHYLVAFGATPDEARETLQRHRLRGPGKAAEACAADSRGMVTQADLMRLLSDTLHA